MAAGGPWSVKGIAPQAREAAKDAARRQGKTLGEWLNEIILETGDEPAAPAGAASVLSPEAYAPPPFAQPAHAAGSAYPDESLDALARRLEAAEHRSTLAITGIDQSVRGLIARLEDAERTAGAVADSAGESVSDLHHAHSELARRLAALEADPTARHGVEAVKSLESAVAKVAGHVHDRDQRAQERAGAIEERLAETETRLAKAAEDLSRRVDAASDHAAMQAQRATNDLRTVFETHQTRTNDALTSLEATIGRINQRLASAEQLTDNAMRSLEASFAHLDTRLRTTEQVQRETSPESIAEKLEQKFEVLGRELRQQIDSVRTETAQTITQTAPRLEKLERALEKSNKRNARTLSKLGDQIGVFGQAVERRLAESERRLREDAMQDRTLETRLREVENSSADAIKKIAEGVEQISLRLAERIEQSEIRNADNVASLGRQIERLAERAPEKRDDDLATRLRESERRTQQMIRDAVAGVSAKLDAVRDETETGLSPVQSALAHLASRLHAIESGEEPPAPEALRPAPARCEARADAPRPRSYLPPAEEALNAPDPAPAPRSEAEPEEEIAIEPPARPNPFTDALTDAPAADDDASGWRMAEPDPIAMPAPIAMEPEHDVVRESLRAEPAPAPAAAPDVTRPLGATADSNFLAAARRSARKAPVETGSRYGRPSVLEAGEEKPAGGRRVLLLAGVLAVGTLGAAATLLFLDGGPFGGDNARIAGELNDPTVIDVLNGESGDQFAAVDGARPPARPVIDAPAQPGPDSADAALQEPASAPDGEATAIAEANAPDAAETAPEATAAVETPAPAPAPVAEAETAPVPAAEAPAPTAPVEPPVTEAPAPTPEARITGGADTGVTGPAAPPAPQAAASSPLEQAAFDGDPAAQYQLGETRLQSGDAEEGAALVRASANQGYAPAQYRLGKLYETGAAGVPRDDAQARAWTERAATAGNRNAMHNLGLMYAEGRGAEQSDQLAAQWFERAALIGATDSQFNLAVLYEQGRGVPQSLPDAYAWYRIAERAGDAEAGERANLLAAQIPDGAVTEAQRVADGFQPRAADPVANGATARAVQPAALTGADMIQRAQQLLASIGYAPGPADGAIGPETRIAIIQYQRDAGMAETGTVDQLLLASLEAAAAN